MDEQVINWGIHSLLPQGYTSYKQKISENPWKHLPRSKRQTKDYGSLSIHNRFGESQWNQRRRMNEIPPTISEDRWKKNPFILVNFSRAVTTYSEGITIVQSVLRKVGDLSDVIFFLKFGVSP